MCLRDQTTRSDYKLHCSQGIRLQKLTSVVERVEDERELLEELVVELLTGI